MPSKSQHNAQIPEIQNEKNAMSDEPRDGRQLTDGPVIGKAPAEKARPEDLPAQPTIDEFSDEGMGVAPKE